MAYRLLLPSSEPLFPKQIEEALDQFDVFRTGDTTPTWSISDLAVEASDRQSCRMKLQLLRDDAVEQAEDEKHFIRPDGVKIWVVLQTISAADDRTSRLSSRLCALTISTRLGLPVLETRNGVFCQSPEAFTAWCSREPHPQTVLLGSTDHVTLPKKRTRGVVRTADTGGAAVPLKHAALPTIGKWERLLRKILKQRTYIVAVPTECDPAVLRALVEEIEGTFGERNVLHDADNHRLLVVGKDSPGTAEVVGYYRRRAHPERLRLAAAVH